MADQKISQLTGGGAAQATDEYVVARAGGNNKITGANVAAAATSVGTLSSLTVSGDLTVDTSTLKVDSANNRVGIGTASPSYTLDVRGNIASVYSGPGYQAFISDGGGANNSYLSLYQAASAWILTANKNGSGSRKSISISTTGGDTTVADLILDTSGNLGLGVTPDAGAKMTVAGGILATAAFSATTGSTAGFDYSGGSMRFFSMGTSGSTKGAYSWIAKGADNSSSTPMTLDASGNLGVGTASPGGQLDVYTSAYKRLLVTYPSTYVTRMQIGSFGYIESDAGNDYYKINAGASGNSNIRFETAGTERARITSGGDFEIGSQAGTGTRTLLIQTNTSGDPTLTLSAAGADGGSFWFDRANARLYARASNTGGVYLAAGGTSWTAVSDERQKDIIEDIADATTKVSALRSVIGRYKTDSEDVRRSFLIAQDVAEAFPEAADTSDEDALGVRYSDVIPLLVAAVKELTARLEALEA